VRFILAMVRPPAERRFASGGDPRSPWWPAGGFGV